MRIVAISDTHAPRFWKRCPPALADALRYADLVLHAGDVCTPDVLDQLAAFAPVRVVRGNNDGPDIAAWGAPLTDEFELDGARLAIIHDSGPATGRMTRLRRRFPSADLVVFGHSHIPLDESSGGLRILNPGSPTEKRRQPYPTFAIIDIADGAVGRTEIVVIR